METRIIQLQKVSNQDKKYPIKTKNIQSRQKVSNQDKKYPIKTKNIQSSPKVYNQDKKYLIITNQSENIISDGKYII